jgi:Fe-S cluster assembly iron-binding protein IscA
VLSDAQPHGDASTEQNTAFNPSDPKFVAALFAIDGESLRLTTGCTVDLEMSMAREGFVVADNPLADHSCSCKRSFSPKQGVI